MGAGKSAGGHEGPKPNEEAFGLTPGHVGKRRQGRDTTVGIGQEKLALGSLGAGEIL